MQRLLAAVLLLAACKKSPPRFCDQDLTGVWLNASDKHFAYRFRDHGDVIRGEFLERQEDGGLTDPPDSVTFEMHRTSDTLAGVMRSTEATASGRVCPVEFGINLTSCNADHLQAQVEMDVPVTDDCKRKTTEDGGSIPPQLAEFRFERAFHRSVGGDGPVSH